MYQLLFNMSLYLPQLKLSSEREGVLSTPVVTDEEIVFADLKSTLSTVGFIYFCSIIIFYLINTFLPFIIYKPFSGAVTERPFKS